MCIRDSFSAVHAPGGALEERDIAEAARVQERLQAMYTGRVTVQLEWERIHGQGFTWHQARNSKKAEEERYKADAKRMYDEGLVEPENDPVDDGMYGYTKAQIRKWRKPNKGPKRSREDDAVIAAFNKNAWEKCTYVDSAGDRRRRDEHKHFKKLEHVYKIYPALRPMMEEWRRYLLARRAGEWANAEKVSGNHVTRVGCYLIGTLLNQEFDRQRYGSGMNALSGSDAAKDLEVEDTLREGGDEDYTLQGWLDKAYAMTREEIHDVMGRYYHIDWKNKNLYEEAHTHTAEFKQFLVDKQENKIPPALLRSMGEIKSMGMRKWIEAQRPATRAPSPVPPAPVRQPAQRGASLGASSSRGSAPSSSSGVTRVELEAIDADVLANVHMESMQMEHERLDKRQRTGGA